MSRFHLYALLLLFFSACQREEAKLPIDRFALVTRHNVIINQPDTLGSLSVGNGEFAFTVDASGLQTFTGEYENGIPPGTQSQWGWHAFKGEKHSLEEVKKEFATCGGRKVKYPIQHKEGNAATATRWLRMNPHRLQLGLTGLVITKKNGERVKLEDLENLHQKLDLWTGSIETSYQVEGDVITVEVYGHQELDLVSMKVSSPLIEKGQLKIGFSFPYGDECHTCAGYNWDSVEKHTTEIFASHPGNVVLERTLDDTKYYVAIAWDYNADFQKGDRAHYFELVPLKKTSSVTLSVGYSESFVDDRLPGFEATGENSRVHWKNFWTEGGAIDFSQCTDPRAFELERRVVLSQYLTKIQCAGSMPPQETGLTMNSWHGKFHLEMHWWHGVHFPLWGRPELLEKSMPWYEMAWTNAQLTAHQQGYAGVRWQKMTDPDGNESPSDVGVFLIWQQPHPIYFAELLYRDNPSPETLEKYRNIVFQTADFMASFARWNKIDKKYHLCHPLIPSQEIFKATETDDPTFELAYWHYGLSTAQAWAQRMGFGADERWARRIEYLTPLPVKDGKYLPVATVPEAYTDNQYRHDHPSVTGALGILPATDRMDTAIMARTFEDIMRKWDWPTTWGWDYPMLAMTAARLGKPERAIDALMLDVQKNTYLVNGHNYQDKRLRLYLPGNGGLLTAVAMMAAGWDGNTVQNPGFPKNGRWNVRWEGLRTMP